MELSYSHRFIFIHVYRVGGQSVAAALQPYSYEPNRYAARLPILRGLGKARVAALREHYYGHITARELEEALSPEVFATFFKFAFVRNPWDWLVSTYHYVLQRPKRPEYPEYELFQAPPGFDAYLEWRTQGGRTEPQSEFVLSDSGELLVDFVGRYETLAEDFSEVCRRIGVDSPLPHRNRSKHADFREYYTPATRSLVAEAYKDDIELFGYAFDQQMKLPPILGAAEAARSRTR